MLKTSIGLSALVISTICVGSAAAATIYTEVGDAGQTLATSQHVNTFPGGTSLDSIRGTLEVGGADLYQIYLIGGKTFSATTTASSLAFNNFDSQLFLFDNTGRGIYANDDDSNSPPQSTLPASIALTPAASGIYYLAISGSGYLPTSLGGFIFPVSGGFLDQSGGGASNAVGPTGPGGASPLLGWSSTSGQAGVYEIQFTGAQFLPSAVVTPEPTSMLLLGAGLAGLACARRRLVGSRS